MKYYKDKNNNIFAYEEDGSQDHLIGDKVLMTAEEVEAHINPPKTEEQIVAEKVAEAKAYLASTDFKVLPDYEPKSDEVITLRATAREFIRVNDVSNP
jgi:hypothetical protein